MRGRRKLLFITLAVMALSGAALLFSVPSEPSYKGRPLSEWIEEVDDVGFNRQRNGLTRAHLYPPKTVQEGRRAVRHIGSNGVPFLMTWIAYQPPFWKQPVYKAVNHVLGWLPTEFRFVDKEAIRAEQASRVFKYVPPVSAETVSRLVLLQQHRDSKIAMRAKIALSDQSERCLDALLATFSSSQPQRRLMAIEGVWTFRTNAMPALPSLIHCLSDSNNHVAARAAFMLGVLQLDATRCVPGLSNALRHSNGVVRGQAATALGRFGANATPTLPLLRDALVDSDAGVRWQASNAVERLQASLK